MAACPTKGGAHEPGEEWSRIHGGGGLLGAHLLLSRTRENIDPLSPDNLLIFASSVIAENEAPSLARFSVIVTDYSIQAMRMGVGAVMGSKNLKALVLKGGHRPPVHDAGVLAELGRRFEADMRANVLSMWQKEPPGFSAYLGTVRSTAHSGG